jgi:hypothetical protein
MGRAVTQQVFVCFSKLSPGICKKWQSVRARHTLCLRLQVMLTDVPEALPLLQRNVQANHQVCLVG